MPLQYTYFHFFKALDERLCLIGKKTKGRIIFFYIFSFLIIYLNVKNFPIYSTKIFEVPITISKNLLLSLGLLAASICYVDVIICYLYEMALFYVYREEVQLFIRKNNLSEVSDYVPDFNNYLGKVLPFLYYPSFINVPRISSLFNELAKKRPIRNSCPVDIDIESSIISSDNDPLKPSLVLPS